MCPQTNARIYDIWVCLDVGKTSKDIAVVISWSVAQDFEDTDDFAEDEFADDDFADESEYIADDVPFSLSTEEEEKGSFLLVLFSPTVEGLGLFSS